MFSKVDYSNYFNDDNMNYKKYTELTNNLFLFHDLRENFEASIYRDIIDIYCKYFYKFKHGFKNVYVMCALLSLFYKCDGEKSLIDNLELSKEDEGFINSQIERFIADDYSKDIMKAIKVTKNDINKIIDVAIALDIHLSFDELAERLELNQSEICIYNYIMAGSDSEDKEKLLDFALDKLNYNVILSDEEHLSEEKMEIEYILKVIL